MLENKTKVWHDLDEYNSYRCRGSLSKTANAQQVIKKDVTGQLNNHLNRVSTQIDPVASTYQYRSSSLNISVCQIHDLN